MKLQKTRLLHGIDMCVCVYVCVCGCVYVCLCVCVHARTLSLSLSLSLSAVEREGGMDRADSKYYQQNNILYPQKRRWRYVIIMAMTVTTMLMI